MSHTKVFEKSLHRFAFRASCLLHENGKNLVYSPASLALAMGMLLEGADGKSRDEIILSMFDPEYKGDLDTVEEASSFLTENISNGDEEAQKLLAIANFCYSKKEFPFHPDYVGTIQKKYAAIARELDFSGNPVHAVQEINNDVSKATKGLIPKLLDDIDAETEAILVNAIHFKGLWSEPFDPELTIPDGDFNLSNGKKIKVPMMTKKITCDYLLKENNVKMISLPYNSSSCKESFKMVFILPESGKLHEYLKNFSATEFKNDLLHLSETSDVNVIIPRFKIECTHSLLPIIRKLGISDIFTSAANLSKLTSNSAQSLHVSEVLQKAVIEVDEKGTEAAAATAIMMRFCAMMSDPIDFIANRPFIYVLVSQNSQNIKKIIFLGVVENPTQ